jgi:3-hydroxyacyl-CoA dehydrogenase
MYPLINEGFKILEEGFAQKPSDIDIVYIYGYGFPPVKGGPMFWADNYVGLDKVLERLRFYNEEARKRYTTNKNYRKIDYYEPSKLLEECVGAGKTLTQVWNAKNKKQDSKL